MVTPSRKKFREQQGMAPAVEKAVPFGQSKKAGINYNPSTGAQITPEQASALYSQNVPGNVQVLTAAQKLQQQKETALRETVGLMTQQKGVQQIQQPTQAPQPQQPQEQKPGMTLIPGFGKPLSMAEEQELKRTAVGLGTAAGVLGAGLGVSALGIGGGAGALASKAWQLLKSVKTGTKIIGIGSAAGLYQRYLAGELSEENRRFNDAVDLIDTSLKNYNSDLITEQELIETFYNSSQAIFLQNAKIKERNKSDVKKFLSGGADDQAAMDNYIENIYPMKERAVRDAIVNKQLMQSASLAPKTI